MPVAQSHPTTADGGRVLSGHDGPNQDRGPVRNRRRGSDRRSGNVQTRNFNDKNYIFREREVGDLAFIVNSGSVEIVKNIDGKDVVLGTVAKGGMFGEMALIDDKPRMASARAVGPVTVTIVSREMFAKKLACMDPFTRGLVGILSDHVRRMAENPSLTAT